ncbi:hypothetical protein [Streptomyces sp. NPDC057509]|uniref:hypothetical protein n=1 Tax=Streptomyces sp. NPDC057509 TaxID=3346152 RepID=UPI0036865ACD
MPLRDDHGRTYAVDQRTGTIGIVMADDGTTIHMRPMHGGPEWTPPRAQVRPATTEEIAAVASR